jgi:serine/threonine protein kinase
MPRTGNIVGGKYRLIEPLGEGSMGSVWLAVHETLSCPFAVKFLKDHEAGHRVEDRFLAEARLAASVRHPFVVAVLDQGRTDEGTPYMVMEYLDGVSLGTRLRVGPALAVVELLHVVEQALTGLAAVHAAGILHRDLKPDNVMLCRGGSASGPLVAKLVDFGISRRLPRSSEGTAAALPEGSTARLTRPGTTVGTPLYMAPELVRALPTVDERSDLYAVGVILYEALTGRAPYQHDDLQALLALMAAGGAAPVSVLRPDLPVALSDLIMRAIASDPAARFVSADELAAALRDVAEAIPPDALCQLTEQPRAHTVGSSLLRAASSDEATIVARSAGRTALVTARPRRRSSPSAWLTAVAVASLAIMASLGWATFTRTPDRLPDGQVGARAADSPATGESQPPRPRPIGAAVTMTSAGGSRMTSAPGDAADAAKTRRPPRAPDRHPPDLFRQPGF